MLQKYAFSVKHASLYNDFQHFAMMTKHVVVSLSIKQKTIHYA